MGFRERTADARGILSERISALDSGAPLKERSNHRAVDVGPREQRAERVPRRSVSLTRPLPSSELLVPVSPSPGPVPETQHPVRKPVVPAQAQAGREGREKPGENTPEAFARVSSRPDWHQSLSALPGPEPPRGLCPVPQSPRCPAPGSAHPRRRSARPRLPSPCPGNPS